MSNKLITNLIAIQDFFWRSLATKIYDKNNLVAWATGINNKYLNGATSTNAKITTEAVQEVIHFFGDQNIPWLWNLNPIMDPEATAKLLLSQGFKKAETHPVMLYDLTEDLAKLDLKNCYIKEAIDEKDLNNWKIPLDEGFKNDQDDGYFNRIKNIPYGKKEAFHHYVVYLDEKPISCATLSYSKYGAKIDNVATCDNFLRQGFAKAVILFALAEAKKFGCKIACLESSDEGLPLYLKLGFKEAYHNIEYVYI